jgi:hypothetical protein
MFGVPPAPQSERTPSLLVPSAGSGFTARELSPAGQVDPMGSEDLIGTTTPIAAQGERLKELDHRSDGGEAVLFSSSRSRRISPPR